MMLFQSAGPSSNVFQFFSFWACTTIVVACGDMLCDKEKEIAQKNHDMGENLVSAESLLQGSLKQDKLKVSSMNALDVQVDGSTRHGPEHVWSWSTPLQAGYFPYYISVGVLVMLLAIVREYQIRRGPSWCKQGKQGSTAEVAGRETKCSQKHEVEPFFKRCCTPCFASALETQEYDTPLVGRQRPCNNQRPMFPCPWLVVPEATECIFQLPYLPSHITVSTQVTISDANNMAAFRAFCTSFPAAHEHRVHCGHESSGAGFLVPAGDPCRSVIACCCMCNADVQTVKIFYKSEDVFAEVFLGSQSGKDQYVARVHTGLQMRLDQDSQDGKTSVKDANGGLLAIIATQASSRTVRIGPLADAGLILLFLLAVDLLSSTNREACTLMLAAQRDGR